MVNNGYYILKYAYCCDWNINHGYLLGLRGKSDVSACCQRLRRPIELRRQLSPSCPHFLTHVFHPRNTALRSAIHLCVILLLTA